MQWLWWVGPLFVAAVYVLNSMWRDKRREREVEAWRKSAGPATLPPPRGAKGKGKSEPVPAGARSVGAMPGQFQRALEGIGGGRRFGYFELVPRLAYVAVMDADLLSGSDYQTVLLKLEAPGPKLTARPLPIVEGNRVANTGVMFKKHPEFGELFLVEGTDAKRIVKYLPRALRDALLGLPEVWLQVDGQTMSLTVYGPASTSKLHELVETADIFFAEYGAGGGPSLVGDVDEEDDRPTGDDDEPAPPAKPEPKTGKPRTEGKGAGGKS